MAGSRAFIAFTVTAAVLFLVLSFNVTVSADTAGECGDDLTWSYDTETKILTISGVGEMYDYNDHDAPWKDLIVSSVVIGNGVTTIGDNAFIMNSEMTQLSLPSTLLSIGDSAFMMCDLASLTIPQSVTTIKEGAFAMTAIMSLTIPSGVTDIGHGAFAGCSLISEINAEGTNFRSIDGVLFSGDGKTLLCYPGGANGAYIIPDGTSAIDNNAFYDCSLTSVVIPEGVTAIGNYAFTLCDSMTSASIPSTLTSIGDSAFAVTALRSVNVPKDVAVIGELAFYDCTSLIDIIMSANDADIGDRAFALGRSSSPIVCEVHTSVDGILDGYGNEYTTFEYIVDSDDDNGNGDDGNDWYIIGAIALILIIVSLLIIRRG